MTEIIQYYTKKKKNKRRKRVYSSRLVLIKKKNGTEIGLFISFEVFALSQKII